MSTILAILHPLLVAVGYLVAFFYSIIPNFAITIILVTVVVMVVLAPLTLKSTRSMLLMQKIAPEVKKIQQQYKGDPRKLNEELMSLYRENHINPLGGCLPMFLQMPAFFILYYVIEGLSHFTQGKHPVAAPLYISPKSRIYHDIIVHKGQLVSFGLNLAQKAWGHHATLLIAVVLWLLVIVAVTLQYIQMWQLTSRNPQSSSQLPSQMQTMQKFFPIIFAAIYINIPAGVNIYFVVSSALRILQQELMYRHDPVVKNIMVSFSNKELKNQEQVLKKQPNQNIPPKGGSGQNSGKTLNKNSTSSTLKKGVGSKGAKTTDGIRKNSKPGQSKPGSSKQGKPVPHNKHEGNNGKNPDLISDTTQKQENNEQDTKRTEIDGVD